MDILVIIVAILFYAFTKIPKLFSTQAQTTMYDSDKTWNQTVSTGTPIQAKVSMEKPKPVQKIVQEQAANRNDRSTNQVRNNVLNGIIWSEIISPPRSKHKRIQRKY